MPTTRKSNVLKKKVINKEKLESRQESPIKSISVTHVAPKKKFKKKTFAKKRCAFKKRCDFPCDEKIQGVERLLVPFHKFYKSNPDSPPEDTNMVLNGTKTGLTPKEKNYIICNCSQRTTRYARLKALASDAEKNKKVFLINGRCKALRDALVDRGWVEKIPPARMNLSTIRNTKYEDDSDMHLALEKLLLSNLVQKSVPYFVWDLKDGWESESLVQNYKVIHNKFNEAALWATKQGLCASVRNNYWYFIQDVAEVTSPRTYNSFDEGEKEEFDYDYKLTACTSLLKWVLSMAANNQSIFCENGTVSLKVIVFALKRCKEYLFQKQNKDIDAPCPNATITQWNGFLKKYYNIISKQEKLKPDKENKGPLYLSYAKYVVRAIYKYRPQLSCEGCHNIWIIKPTHCSRGRGIRLASKLGIISELLNKGKYVFQKYIEESMLVHETKFDIRQYYLVTSTTPLVIWMYQDCYLKFSSQKYNLKNYHESIHLTNNAVQRKYKNCTNRHPELPQHNMWNLPTFKEYLDKTGRKNVWEKTVYPGMKKSIIGIMLSCQESTSSWKNRFELYGCDFILDKNCKPWLIEINSGPDLTATTRVTAEICPAVLSDLVKVVVDHAENPKASTGKFECIYRQNISMRPCGRADNLIVQGNALPNNYFSRGISEVLLNDVPKETVKHSKKKSPCRKTSKFSQKVSFKNAKLEDCIDYPDSPIISFHSEDKSKFSLHSSPSSNNFRHVIFVKNESASNDNKSIALKPIHKPFDFSQLDDDDEDICGDELHNLFNDITSENANLQETVVEFIDPVINDTNNYSDDDKLSVSEIIEPTGENKQEPDSGHNTEKGGVTEAVDDEFFEASKKIFSFLDRKHKEYIKDVFCVQK